jgi:hypothetical protein
VFWDDKEISMSVCFSGWCMPALNAVTVATEAARPLHCGVPATVQEQEARLNQLYDHALQTGRPDPQSYALRLFAAGSQICFAGQDGPYRGLEREAESTIVVTISTEKTSIDLPLDPNSDFVRGGWTAYLSHEDDGWYLIQLRKKEMFGSRDQIRPGQIFEVCGRRFRLEVPPPARTARERLQECLDPGFRPTLSYARSFDGMELSDFIQGMNSIFGTDNNKQAYEGIGDHGPLLLDLLSRIAAHEGEEGCRARLIAEIGRVGNFTLWWELARLIKEQNADFEDERAALKRLADNPRFGELRQRLTEVMAEAATGKEVYWDFQKILRGL